MLWLSRCRQCCRGTSHKISAWTGSILSPVAIAMMDQIDDMDDEDEDSTTWSRTIG